MLTYRPDIDGLRAIAVLCVLFYHLDPSWLSGGFVGVDVFFVISGYLITKLIVKELSESKSFSFKNFYLRRARRLFPALGVTFAFCLVLAYYIFSPQHLAEFAESLIYAIFSLSNVFFWSGASYFDTASEMKPLLHTWSLSVEEQFYLLWPLTLMLLAKLENRFFSQKQRLTIGFIIVMGVVSLLLNHIFFSNQQSIIDWYNSATSKESLDVHATVFYLLPFRVFEFAIGAILAFYTQRAVAMRGAELAFIFGLAMVLYSAINFDSKMNFPSFAGLLPCVGAGLMIYSGPAHRLTGLVSNRLMVGIGLISYSLYLIHWPIIVFYKYWHYQALALTEKIGIIALSFLLAYVMYKLIEQPFRKLTVTTQSNGRAKGNRPFLAGCGVSVVLLLAVTWNATSSGGWLWRYPPQVVEQLGHKKGHYSEYFWNNIGQLERDFQSNGKPKVLVIGDSMAADLVNALVEGGSAEKLDLATIKIDDNCRALFPLTDSQLRQVYFNRGGVCRAQIAKVMSKIDVLRQADSVILASYWWETRYLDFVQSTAAYLRSIHVPQVMVLGVKDQQSHGILFLAKHSFSPRLHKIRTPVNPRTTVMNEALRQRATDYQYFDLLDQFCDPQGCQRVTEDGYIIIFDGSHMTQQGAALVGSDLERQPWFQSILATDLPATK